MSKLLGLDKVFKFFEIIRANGGIRGSLSKLYRTDDLKVGTLVGTDKYGNKYFENPYYFYGRNRWIEYAPHNHLEYDGSQIPAEWYGWMHYKTDLPPDRDGMRPKYKWMLDHSENLSGRKEHTCRTLQQLRKFKRGHRRNPISKISEQTYWKPLILEFVGISYYVNKKHK